MWGLVEGQAGSLPVAEDILSSEHRVLGGGARVAGVSLRCGGLWWRDGVALGLSPVWGKDAARWATPPAGAEDLGNTSRFAGRFLLLSSWSFPLWL